MCYLDKPEVIYLVELISLTLKEVIVSTNLSYIYTQQYLCHLQTWPLYNTAKRGVNEEFTSPPLKHTHAQSTNKSCEKVPSWTVTRIHTNSLSLPSMTPCSSSPLLQVLAAEWLMNQCCFAALLNKLGHVNRAGMKKYSPLRSVWLNYVIVKQSSWSLQPPPPHTHHNIVCVTFCHWHQTDVLQKKLKHL